jgi:hypothetical protein
MTSISLAPERGNRRKTKRLLAVSLAVLLASALAVPASATLSGPGVRAGKNITVFHNIDFVAVFGYGPVGNVVTVEVIRDGVTLGTATGPTVDTPEGAALEVNHGPEGIPQDGDCFEGHTPDILPGDIIRVHDGAATDQVTVDNIRFTGKPFVERSTQDIVVPGVAKRANGNPIPVSFLDSGEFRDTSKFRGAPDKILATNAHGGFEMRYHSPYNLERNEIYPTKEQRKRSLLGDGHAVGFGHVAVLPLEAMLVDGVADAPGPALGCEGSPSARHAVTSLSRKMVNAGNLARNLTVAGVSHDASKVVVKLNDGNPATAPVTATATPSAAERQTWKVTLPAGTGAARGVADLSDGMLTASAAYTLPDGVISGANLSLRKDTVAPKAPRATPKAGTYGSSKLVTLKSAARNKIHFTKDGSRPTMNSRVFRHPIRVRATKKIKAFAVDPSGNRSPVAIFKYIIR